jgi:hypothetical protein
MKDPDTGRSVSANLLFGGFSLDDQELHKTAHVELILILRQLTHTCLEVTNRAEDRVGGVANGSAVHERSDGVPTLRRLACRVALHDDEVEGLPRVVGRHRYEPALLELVEREAEQSPLGGTPFSLRNRVSPT